MYRVRERRELPIQCEDDVVLVRRAVRELAEKNGFGPFAVAALTTAASELTRNVWQYATRGSATIELVQEGTGKLGVRVSFADQGPGIADLERVMRGGFSTGGSLGIGLSGSRRLVDEFNIDSAAGRGTTVTVTKWQRR